VSTAEKEALRDTVQALVTALGIRSSNALWEAARVNKNDWNDRLRPYVAKTTGKKQVDRLIDGLLGNLELSPEQREVLETHRAAMYRAIGIDPRLVPSVADPPGTEPAAPPPVEPVEGPPVVPPHVEADPALAALRDRMRDLWIDGVLRRSLAGPHLDLDRVEQRDAVERPWNIALPEGEADGELHPIAGRTLDVFDRASCELLILGAAGSGKTTALLEIARDAMARAEQDPARPLPVIFMLSNWSADQNGFSDWLIAELNLRYHVARRDARRWLVAGRLILLLDGLDELPTGLRAACVQSINEFRRRGHGHVHLAVACRRDDYEALSVRLSLSSAILIRPLTDAQIAGYLAGAGQANESARTILERDDALFDLVHSPLMLSILRTTAAGSGAGGDDLADGMPARDAAGGPVRGRLFDSYLSFMFRRRGQGHGYSWDQVLRYLRWLAQCMSAHNRSIFFVDDVQPSWLPARWRGTCIALVGAAVGLCLAAPGAFLAYFLIGSVIPAFAWAVVFWLIWTLRVGQVRGPSTNWRPWHVLRVLLVCLTGAVVLQALESPAAARPTAAFWSGSVLLGLALAIAWGLTWLARSRELLSLPRFAWWRQHWPGLAVATVTVALPFLLLFPADSGRGLRLAAGLGAPAISLAVGLLLGLGAGAACVPFWQVEHWRRLLRPVLVVTGACLATVLAFFATLGERLIRDPALVSGPVFFFGLLIGLMATLLVALRLIGAPSVASGSWTRADRTIAGVLFGTCIPFVPNPGNIAMMLAIMLALALDPGGVHATRRRFRVAWRRLLALLLFSPVYAFFVTLAGVLTSPTISLSVAGMRVASTGVPTLPLILAVSVPFGIGTTLILLAAVGLEEADEPRPDEASRSQGESARRALIALVSVVGLLVATWALVMVEHGVLFNVLTPKLLVALLVIAGVVSTYAALLMGGATLIDRTLVRLYLRRLDLMAANPVSFLDCCVDMMILQRVGDGYMFTHSLLLDHLTAMPASPVEVEPAA
jgi:NACHT domain